MAASSALAAAAYATAPAANQSAKAQALDAVASAGTAGQAALAQTQQGIDSNRQAAINSAISGGFGGQAITAGQKDLGFLDAAPGAPVNPNSALGALSASNQLASSTLANDTTRKQNNLNDYFSQVNAAIPIEQSRTQGAIEKILADEREKAAENEYQKQMQSMSLQEAQARLAATLAPASQNLSYSEQQKANTLATQNGVMDAVSKNADPAMQKAFISLISGINPATNKPYASNDARIAAIMSADPASYAKAGVDQNRLLQLVKLYGRPDLAPDDYDTAIQQILAPTSEEKQAQAVAAAKQKNKKPGKSVLKSLQDQLSNLGGDFAQNLSHGISSRL